MSEEFTLIGYKVNELLYYWRGTYWRWTRSPMVKDDPSNTCSNFKFQFFNFFSRATY